MDKMIAELAKRIPTDEEIRRMDAEKKEDED